MLYLDLEKTRHHLMPVKVCWWWQCWYEDCDSWSQSYVRAATMAAVLY